MPALGHGVEAVVRPDDQPPAYSGEKTFGADIVLRKPWERGLHRRPGGRGDPERDTGVVCPVTRG